MIFPFSLHLSSSGFTYNISLLTTSVYFIRFIRIIIILRLEHELLTCCMLTFPSSMSKGGRTEQSVRPMQAYDIIVIEPVNKMVNF